MNARGTAAACAVLLLALTPPLSFAVSGGEAWERDVFFGLSASGGNADALSGNLRLDARRGETADLSASASYGRSGGEKNLDRSSASARWRRNFGKGHYAGFGARAERDSVGSLDYRYILGPVLGRRFHFEEDSHISIEAGPAYLGEKSGGESDSGAAARFFEAYERKLGAVSRFQQSLEYTVEPGGGHLVFFEAAAVSSLSRGTSLWASFEAHYDSSPAEGRKKFDMYLVASLGFSF